MISSTEPLRFYNCIERLKKIKILSRVRREIKEPKLKTKLLLLMNGDYMIDRVPIFGKFLPPPLALIHARQTWLQADGVNFQFH